MTPLQSFDVPLPHPPVISHDRDSREALPGLRFLREEVKRDCDLLERLLRKDANPSALSTNAPYLIAVWDELVHARHPVAIYRTFSPANGQDKARGKGRTPLKSQTRPVKVDVVAENGARWVRVNTIKNARLMMEFREIDSYLTSDEARGRIEAPPGSDRV
ncbi:hypothetical protein J3R83DRAFT_13712 [Lanmaoa asiatica]|nr:hypothetical protein J3R83DRAFT_13712 [Lanmaoa asiatica]